MGLLGWIARFLLVLFILRLLLRFLFSLVVASRRPSRGAGPRPGPMPGSRPTERLGGALVQDPECGTYVAQASAVSTNGPNGPVYFCSAACRDAWTAKGGRSQARPA